MSFKFTFLALFFANHTAGLPTHPTSQNTTVHLLNSTAPDISTHALAKRTTANPPFDPYEINHNGRRTDGDLEGDILYSASPNATASTRVPITCLLPTVKSAVGTTVSTTTTIRRTKATPTPGPVRAANWKLSTEMIHTPTVNSWRPNVLPGWRRRGSNIGTRMMGISFAPRSMSGNITITGMGRRGECMIIPRWLAQLIRPRRN